MTALLLHALRGLRGQIAWYGLGLGLWAAVVCFMFIALQDSLGDVEYPQEFLDAFGAEGTGLDDPRAYLSTEFFSMAPLIAGAFVVFASTGALAGEEGAGRMEMLAALPLSRRSMFIAKVVAIAVALLGIATLTVVGWLVAIPFVDLGHDVDAWRLTGATVAQIPLLAFIVATGMLFGAIAPTRSAAAAWTGTVLILSYLLVAIGSIAESASALKYISPYYYSDLSGILLNGITAWHLAALGAATVAVGYVAARAFEGRELGSERWQFATMLGPRSIPRRSGGVGSRSRRLNPWWLVGGLAAVIVVGASTVLGGRYLATRPVTLEVEGRVDARHAHVVAPASGLIRLLTVRERDYVEKAQAIGWIETADGAFIPFVSTMTGSVTAVEIESGQFVLAGTPLVVIYDLRTLYLVLTIDEDDVHRVQVGDVVEARFTTVGIVSTTNAASIAPIPHGGDPTRTNQDRTYEIEAPLDDPDPRILVGMPVKARITVSERRADLP